ncbi:uncharacterized protein B0T23DRAFT_324217, partial [Neurospora hispaniola]
APQSLEYDPRFSVLVNTVKYLSRYTINSIPSRIVNLGIDNICVVLLNFIADLID